MTRSGAALWYKLPPKSTPRSGISLNELLGLICEATSRLILLVEFLEPKITFGGVIEVAEVEYVSALTTISIFASNFSFNYLKPNVFNFRRSICNRPDYSFFFKCKVDIRTRTLVLNESSNPVYVFISIRYQLQLSPIIRCACAMSKFGNFAGLGELGNRCQYN